MQEGYSREGAAASGDGGGDEPEDVGGGPATQIIETSGPTTLDVGDFENLDWARRVGTELKGAKLPADFISFPLRTLSGPGTAAKSIELFSGNTGATPAAALSGKYGHFLPVSGTLTFVAGVVPEMQLDPDNGPAHITFSVYVNGALVSSLVTVCNDDQPHHTDVDFAVDANDGLNYVNVVATIDAGYSGSYSEVVLASVGFRRS